MPSTSQAQVHPRRAAIHTRSLGESLADAIAEGMGSWRFIIIQSAIVLAWIGANLWLLSRPFDAYPFILLNLLFSTQAAYSAPVIMMSQNRQASKDRKRDSVEANEVDAMFRQGKQLYDINQRQLEILELLHSHWPVTPITASPKGDQGEHIASSPLPDNNGVHEHEVEVTRKPTRKRVAAPAKVARASKSAPPVNQ